MSLAIMLICYRGIEDLLAIIGRVSVMSTVESILESWVSIVEHHSPPSRTLLDQERLDAEAHVAINGPSVQHADNLLQSANKEYWRKFIRPGDREGHFVRRSDNVKIWKISKAVDNLMSEGTKLPFMT